MTTRIIAQNLERSAPVVSVIIPTHNRAEMLRRAISSVLAQTWQDFEVIVISDGSSDNTEAVIRSFNDSIIRLLKHEKSKGASAARNTGLRTARGKYIAFLDDDDEWTANKLAVQVPVIEKSSPEIGLVYAWMEYFEDSKSIRILAPKLRGNVFVEMLDKQAIGGCQTIIIKREVINTIGYFDEELPRGNDGDFIRRIAKYYSVDYVPKVLARVHVGHEDRISVDSRKNLKDAIFALGKRLKDFEEDFSKYPNQKANVLAKIGTTCFMTGQIRKGSSCFRRIMQGDSDIIYKSKLIFQSIKSFLKFAVRKALVSVIQTLGRRTACTVQQIANFKKS